LAGDMPFSASSTLISRVPRALDRTLLHRVASAAIREFTAQVAARITGHPGAVAGTTPNGAGASPADVPGPS